VLTPGRYVGAADVEDDETPFVERFEILRARLDKELSASDALSVIIKSRLSGLVA